MPPPLGPADGSFSSPSRVATDSSSNVYVTDSGNSRVQKFTSTGTFLSKFGTLGTGNGQFLAGSALGIAVDSSGNSYVVDKLGSQIQKFNSSGAFVTAWGSAGSGNGQFATPTGIAVDSSNNLYVADSGNNRIQEFTSSGAFVTKWGTLGTGDGQFNSPTGVAVDSTGNVYVADSGNSRIQKFTSSGAFVTKWGSAGTGDGQFGPTTTTPLDLAIGASDNVVVVDPTNSRVEKFRPIGTFITKWGTAGAGAGQFTLPSGVAISASDEVYVVDSGNSRVERFHETDTVPPTTSLDAGPSGTSGPGVSFSFSSPDSLLSPGFECRLDSGEWEACNSPRSYSGLSDGAHTFRVRAVDSAGNPDPSATVRTWTVDAIPPDTTIDSGPSGTTSDASPSFTFSSSEAGSSFECRLDAGAWQGCSSPKSYSSLADGSHTFEVRATDAVGNTDPTPASRTFTVDATPPQTTINSGPSGATNDASPSFTFSSSEAGSSFECRLDAGAWQGCSSPKSYSGLADGSHTFQVRATDPAGNTDPTPPSRTFTVDTQAPDTTIDSGPSGTTSDASPSFTFSSSEAGSSFECRLDAGAWQGCSSPKSYSGLADGSHTFEVRATDAVGNTDPSPASRSFDLDTQAPAAPQITATSPASPANNNNPMVKGSAEAGAQVRLYTTSDCSGAPVAQGSAAQFASPGLAAAVPDNSTTAFRATAQDAAGHTSPCSAPRQYVEDSVAPAMVRITGTDPASPANDNSPKVKGNAEPGSRVRLYTTTGCAGHPVVAGPASQFHSTGLSVSVADNSTTSFRARASDRAGNISPCSKARTYVEDSKAPAAPVIKATSPASPANDNQPLVRGAVEAPSAVAIYSTPDCTGAPLASGTASQFHSPGLRVSVADNTTTSFRAVATDPAGNSSRCSAPLPYVEDSTPPQTTITSGPSGQTRNRRPTFSFTSSEPGSSFRCRLDSQPFGSCSGPGASHTPYVALSTGPHTFYVRAIDPAGNVDASPASRAFTVVP